MDNKNILVIIAVIYIVLINVTAFIMYGIDKNKAKKHRWRIPEATLIGVAVIGGSVGALIGMQFFRHKTKHPKFYIGVPLIIILQILAMIFLSAFRQ